MSMLYLNHKEGRTKPQKHNKGSDRRYSGKGRRKDSKMKINMNKKTIELTKSEMKSATVFGTTEYDDLQTIRSHYPNFRVVEIKSKRNTSDFANLTLNDIKTYVAKRGTDEQKDHFSFISKRTVTEDGEYCEAQPFFQIKAWFLNEFPEIKETRKEYRTKITSIYEAAKRVA